MTPPGLIVDLFAGRDVDADPDDEQDRDDTQGIPF